MVVRVVDTCEYFWPLKKSMVNYVTHCFLDTNNTKCFEEGSDTNQVWTLAELIVNDMINIVENLQTEEDVYVKYPSTQISTLRQEANDFIT